MLNWLLTLEEAVMLQTVSRFLPELPLFFMTAVATHLVMSFAQTLMHYKLGHHPMGGKFFRNHINFHHTYYSKGHLVSRTYRGDEGNNTPFFFIPMFLVGAYTYLVLPIDLFVVQVVACAASFYAHVFFDKEYHVEGSRLQRFAWFRRKQKLHFVHHRHANCNFAVIHFFWDRILGTYRRPDARFRGQKRFPNQLVPDSKPHLLSRSDLESNAAWKSLYGVPQIVANPVSNMTPSTVDAVTLTSPRHVSGPKGGLNGK
jgi:sterol desaturase/sphingolipid hydroxylase (fatty acid hydroxylase superfamily)